MAGALFNILIPTKQHEVHLTQHIQCDCSTQTPKHHHNYQNKCDVNTHDEKRSNINSTISMEKVSVMFILKLH